jgi:ABC-type phosphate/phosphonate transport system ATPase subunit
MFVLLASTTIIGIPQSGKTSFWRHFTGREATYGVQYQSTGVAGYSYIEGVSKDTNVEIGMMLTEDNIWKELYQAKEVQLVKDIYTGYSLHHTGISSDSYSFTD